MNPRLHFANAADRMADLFDIEDCLGRLITGNGQNPVDFQLRTAHVLHSAMLREAAHLIGLGEIRRAVESCIVPAHGLRVFITSLHGFDALERGRIEMEGARRFAEACERARERRRMTMFQRARAARWN